MPERTIRGRIPAARTARLMSAGPQTAAALEALLRSLSATGEEPEVQQARRALIDAYGEDRFPELAPREGA